MGSAAGHLVAGLFDGRLDGLVVDLRSGSYASLAPVPGAVTVQVLSARPDAFEHNPPTLEGRWREVSVGIYRLNDCLLVILDVERLLTFAA